MIDNLFDDATRARLLKYDWITRDGRVTKWGLRALRDASLDGNTLRALEHAQRQFGDEE